MGLSSALASCDVRPARQSGRALDYVVEYRQRQHAWLYHPDPNQVEVASGGPGSSVQVTGVTRELDLFIQSQLRTETGGAGFANQNANILGQLQSVYGTPGGTGTLETAFNNFTSALQAVSTSTTGLIGADDGAERGAGAGAATQHHDARHPDAAHECRSGYRHFGDAGQYRHAADRADQHPAPGLEPDRSDRRDAGGSTRQRHQQSFELDGRPRHPPTATTRSMSSPLRRSTRRRGPGFAIQLQLGGNADADLAL